MNDSATSDPRTRSGARAPSSRGEETRTALLAAGRSAFSRRGFDGASIRDITREARTNLGAVTYHFGSKRGLYAAVLEAGLTPLVDRVGEAAASRGTPLERLGRVVEAFFGHLAVHADLPRLMLQEVAAGKTPPPQVVAIIQRNAGYVMGIIRDGWEDGTIRRGHPLFSALSVAALPLYMSIMAPLIREVGGIDLADPAARAAAAEHVKRFVERGLAAHQEDNA